MRWPWQPKPVESIPSPAPKERNLGLASAANKAKAPAAQRFPITAPTHAKGVLPAGVTKSPVAIAMDSWADQFPGSLITWDVAGFPGYPYLSMLATRAEYRAMASALSTELTREWIEVNSSETAGEATKTKVTELTKAIEDMGLQQVIQRAAEHDAYFGRAQILITLKGHENKLDTPLIIAPQTITKSESKDPWKDIGVIPVEAIWTTPAGYNALDPAAKDFYKPPIWYMLGQKVHSSRLMTIITRPLPDMLKPAFNFGGMSLSQLAEPYVNNWLRTRQSVADLINNFSIISLATSMEQVLQGGEGPDADGTNLLARADLFTAARSNRGLMLVDKEREELQQIAVPLGSLDNLQAQAQEHMCSVSRMPSIVLTGIEPTGLNTSSEGTMRAWYDWIAAQQEAYWWSPVDKVVKILQLLMYGEIDPDITFTFVPLFQMTGKELAEIRKTNADTATAYVAIGAVDNMEVRENIARDPESGYQGLDLSKEITPPDEGDDDEGSNDKED